MTRPLDTLASSKLVRNIRTSPSRCLARLTGSTLTQPVYQMSSAALKQLLHRNAPRCAMSPAGQGRARHRRARHVSCTPIMRAPYLPVRGVLYLPLPLGAIRASRRPRTFQALPPRCPDTARSTSRLLRLRCVFLADELNELLQWRSRRLCADSSPCHILGRSRWEILLSNGEHA